MFFIHRPNRTKTNAENKPRKNETETEGKYCETAETAEPFLSGFFLVRNGRVVFAANRYVISFRIVPAKQQLQPFSAISVDGHVLTARSSPVTCTTSL